MFKITSVAALTLCFAALPFTASAEETRCGWFERSDPRTAWLVDADEMWLLSEHGEGSVLSMSGHWPVFPEDQWIRISSFGNGIGCACLTGEFEPSTRELQSGAKKFRGGEALVITASKVLALKQCIEDRNLTMPELPW